MKMDFNCISLSPNLRDPHAVYKACVSHTENMNSWSNSPDYATNLFVWQIYRLGDWFYLWKYVVNDNWLL